MLIRTLSVCVAILCLFPTTEAEAGPYYSYEVAADNGAKLPGAFSISNNCGGCPKGEAGGIAPAVLEYILASDASAVRNHYAHMAQYRLGEIKGSSKKPMQSWGLIGGEAPTNDTSKNPLLQTWFEGDVAHVVDAQQDYLYGATGGTDYMSVLEGSKDGVHMARAVAKQTAAAANEMIGKKTRAQYLWGYKWTEKDGTYTTPTVAGAVWTLLIPNEADNTVAMHLFSTKLDKKPAATFDVSGLPGAFDPASSMSYDDVAAGIKTK